MDWDNLGFGLIETDFMYVAKCGPDGIFSKGEVLPFGPIALSPSAGVLNYGQVSRESSHPVSYLYLYWIGTTITWQLGIFEGLLVLSMLILCYSGTQGLFEGLKAYRKTDGSILLFRPEENAIRMISGAERMCMPAPTVEQFVDAVKQTVLANKRWVSNSNSCFHR